MKEDPAIAEVRRVRHRISAEHGHDTRRLVEHYMRLQERHRDRLIYAEKPVQREEAA